MESSHGTVASWGLPLAVALAVGLSTALIVYHLMSRKKSRRGQKKLLVIRHAQDAKPDDPFRRVAARFENWHSPSLSQQSAAAFRDPVLTECGVQAAGDGIDDEQLRLRLNETGYGGRRGGLRAVARDFGAQLIICSPLARALQTALVCFDDSAAPIIVLDGLKEMKADLTKGGLYPLGKPSCRGLPRPEIEKALARYPRSSGGVVDCSALDAVWFDPTESEERMSTRLRQLSAWLAARPETRIAVVSHGGCLHRWTGRKLAHAQHALLRFPSELS